jgi:hypothetical protein
VGHLSSTPIIYGLPSETEQRFSEWSISHEGTLGGGCWRPNCTASGAVAVDLSMTSKTSITARRSRREASVVAVSWPLE